MTGCASPAANPPAAAISTNNQQVAIASHSSDGACSVVTEAQQLTTEGSQGIITTLHCLTTHQEHAAKSINYFPLINGDLVQQVISQGKNLKKKSFLAHSRGTR